MIWHIPLLKAPTMTALMSVSELAACLSAPDVAVLDASFTMPGVQPDALALYGQRHIPGAGFFDIDGIADQSSDLPHMLPAPRDFAAAVGAMGISNESTVVLYDTPGLMSAGRAWWSFRIMGHRDVRVLNGGLKAWLQEGHPVTDALPSRAPTTYTARRDAALLRTKAQVLANLTMRTEQVIDARSSDRFYARAPEPRPVLRGGHIPGSLNVSFDQLTGAASGKIRPVAELQAIFEKAGLTEDRPIITTCGSGVTAGALFFALHLIGRDDVALYDGSWTEWGMPGETPVETGA